MIFDVIIISAGLTISLILFFRFPVLNQSSIASPLYRVSIIIPARNEESNLSLLLQDLKKQVYPLYEIICVDDCSTDDTGKVALKYGINLIKISDKPKDWTGKSWACQKGAEAAGGVILLFLDADVRLRPDGISSLMKVYDKNQCVISVQPYHQTVKSYEQFSLFFNLIQIAANGTCMFSDSMKTGLFGPVILFPKEIYKEIEGHTSVKNSIVDDIALGEKLTETGFPFKLFLGGKYIYFRMYSGGIAELIQGWTKNFATGALNTHMVILVMVFFWICSCTSAVLTFLQSIISQDLYYLIICFLLYVLWIVELFRISREIGNFKKLVLISFPLYLALFFGIFILSLVKKLFHMNVVWKDRKIKLEK